MSNPVSALAGFFPQLEPTPKPRGGPVPDREAERDGHHIPRGRSGQRVGWKQCVEHRTDGAYVYAVAP